MRLELLQRRKEVSGRVRARVRPGEHVRGEFCTGQGRVDAVVTRSVVAGMNAVFAVHGQVVRKDEAIDLAGEVRQSARVAEDDRVVIDDNVARFVGQLEEVSVSAPFRAVDPIEEVATNDDAVGLATWRVWIDS